MGLIHLPAICAVVTFLETLNGRQAPTRVSRLFFVTSEAALSALCANRFDAILFNTILFHTHSPPLSAPAHLTSILVNMICMSKLYFQRTHTRAVSRALAPAFTPCKAFTRRVGLLEVSTRAPSSMYALACMTRASKTALRGPSLRRESTTADVSASGCAKAAMAASKSSPHNIGRAHVTKYTFSSSVSIVTTACDLPACE